MRDKFLKSAAIGAAAGFANGLFGAGGGTILVPAEERLFKVKPQKAHATAIAVILLLSIVSAFFYISKGEFLTKYIIFTSLGGVVGSFLGSKLLSKCTGKQLHRIFGLFMIIAAVRMII